MMVENQELLKNANARVKSLEQKIESRKHGGSGKYVGELTKAKAERDKLLFRITNDSTETEELIQYALEVDKKADASAERTKELSERLDALSLYFSCIENSINKKDIPELVCETTPKPDFSEIGIRMKKERNLQGALTKAQKDFDSALYKSQNAPKIYSGKYVGELQRTRNKLNSVLKRVEQFPSLIEFYELRAEIEWLETVITELEAYSVKQQEYFVKRQAEINLLKKYGYITAEILT